MLIKKGKYDRIIIVFISLGMVFTFANTFWIINKINSIKKLLKNK